MSDKEIEFLKELHTLLEKYNTQLTVVYNDLNEAVGYDMRKDDGGFLVEDRIIGLGRHCSVDASDVQTLLIMGQN